MDDMYSMSPESQCTAFWLALKAIYRHFGPVYLNRLPSLQEHRDLQDQFQKEGSPGCIGSVDCMHLHWKIARGPTRDIITTLKMVIKLAALSCEAVADGDLY